MQKTDLNVSPYYDDFSEDSLFHRVLFRPAYSVQARELTQMQTILQNQIERLGSHFFKEGAVVIPGQTGFDITYSYVKLQTTFTVSGTTHTAENFRTSLVGTKLTGATTGVIAKVIDTSAADGSDDLTIFVKYESSGTVAGGTTNTVFGNGESLTTDTAIAYTSGGSTVTIPAAGQVALTSAAAASGVGSSASVQKGIFYIRGAFVQALTQTIILDKYSNSPSYRIGFSVTESLVTPEENTGLLDNSTGSTNFAAKGAHRLKYTLTLTKKALGTADDADFIELVTMDEGERGRIDLVMLCEDNDGNGYRIRPPFHPKEIARFHSLLIKSNLEPVFQGNHEFLLIFDMKDRLVGGVYWKESEKTNVVHFEWIVIRSKYRNKHLSNQLMDELINRLRNKGVQYVIVGFFQEEFFYKHGFKIDKNFGGLVKDIQLAVQETSPV